MEKVSEKVARSVERLASTDDNMVSKVIESHIKELESQKAVLQRDLGKKNETELTTEEKLETVYNFISKPYKLWDSGALDDQRTALKLTFSNKLIYDKENGFRTAAYALPFRLLRESASNNSSLVHPAGVEPTTSAFGGQHSIH